MRLSLFLFGCFFLLGCQHTLMQKSQLERLVIDRPYLSIPESLVGTRLHHVLTYSANGENRQFVAVIEIDAKGMSIVISDLLGVTLLIARLNDNQLQLINALGQFREEEFVALIAKDIQLALWPAEMLVDNSFSPLTLRIDAKSRLLSWHDQLAIHVKFEAGDYSNGEIIIENYALNYRIMIHPSEVIKP